MRPAIAINRPRHEHAEETAPACETRDYKVSAAIHPPPQNENKIQITFAADVIRRVFARLHSAQHYSPTVPRSYSHPPGPGHTAHGYRGAGIDAKSANSTEIHATNVKHFSCERRNTAEVVCERRANECSRCSTAYRNTNSVEPSFSWVRRESRSRTMDIRSKWTGGEGPLDSVVERTRYGDSRREEE